MNQRGRWRRGLLRSLGLLLGLAWLGLAMIPQLLAGPSSGDFAACVQSGSGRDIAQKALAACGIAALVGATAKRSTWRSALVVAVLALVVAWWLLATC